MNKSILEMRYSGNAGCFCYFNLVLLTIGQCLHEAGVHTKKLFSSVIFKELLKKKPLPFIGQLCTIKLSIQRSVKQIFSMTISP